MGVKAATYNHLLFTEISSKAFSKNWIHEMARNFSQEKTIIIGLQKLRYKKNSLGNLLIRFDHLLKTVQSLSFVKFQSPYRTTFYLFIKFQPISKTLKNPIKTIHSEVICF